MTDEEIQLHAQRLGDELLSNAEFCIVYEDDALVTAHYDDQKKIHDVLVSLVAYPNDEE